MRPPPRRRAVHSPRARHGPGRGGLRRRRAIERRAVRRGSAPRRSSRLRVDRAHVRAGEVTREAGQRARASRIAAGDTSMPVTTTPAARARPRTALAARQVEHASRPQPEPLDEPLDLLPDDDDTPRARSWDWSRCSWSIRSLNAGSPHGRSVVVGAQARRGSRLVSAASDSCPCRCHEDAGPGSLRVRFHRGPRLRRRTAASFARARRAARSRRRAGGPAKRSAASSTVGSSARSPTVLRKTPGCPSTNQTAESMSSCRVSGSYQVPAVRSAEPQGPRVIALIVCTATPRSPHTRTSSAKSGP